MDIWPNIILSEKLQKPCERDRVGKGGSMKKFLGCVCFFLSVVFIPGWSWADVWSTFGADLDGWECPDPSTNCYWNANGFLEFQDEGGSVAFAKAPAKFLGDWTEYASVGSITFSHQVIDPGEVAGYLPYKIELWGEWLSCRMDQDL